MELQLQIRIFFPFLTYLALWPGTSTANLVLNTTLDNPAAFFATSHADMKAEGSNMTWDAYHRVKTIHGWMDDLAAANPENVQILEIGKSTEGRSLKVIKISYSGGENKPAVFLDGGIHAREWVAPAAVTYIVKNLTANLTPSSEAYKQFDWYILPVVNPDGYEFTSSTPCARFWRKTRSETGSRSARACEGTSDQCSTKDCNNCAGVDANRNFAYQWRAPGGSSTDKCDSTFRGNSQASEPEVKAIQNFLLENRKIIKFPFPHADSREHTEIGNAAARAIQSSTGRNYSVGIPLTLVGYPSSGSSMDYAKAVAGIKYSFSVELSPEYRQGQSSIKDFHLPPEQIVGVGQDAVTTVLTMVSKIKK